MRLCPNTGTRIVAMLAAASTTIGCIRAFKTKEQSTTNSTPPSLDRCIALRGNGTHAIAHLAALARITQEWGEVNAIAGGSSSTISTFLYESILLNPAVDRLTGRERADAISLLLKTIPGYVTSVNRSVEWRALIALTELAAKLLANPQSNPDPSAVRELSEDLKKRLENSDTWDLVNAEVLRNLDAAIASGNLTRIRYLVGETSAAIEALKSLDASSPDVFVRDGILNFPYMVEMVGRVADFYAGIDGSEEGFTKFIRHCAPGTKTLLWKGIAPFNTPSGNCGTMFESMVTQWRSSRSNKTSTRPGDAPGRRLPSIMITAVMRDQSAISALNAYRAAWANGLTRQLDIPFRKVEFGYWVSPGFSGDPVHAIKQTFPGLKSSKAFNLGAARTWREILEKSPREPSLGSAVEFAPSEPSAGAVSLGGWADLHPVQILRSGGCKEIIYLTRRTDETKFVTRGKPFTARAPSGLAELLGMNAAEYTQLYDLDDRNSAFSQALKNADGVWCTNWNTFSATQQAEIADDAWSAPLLAAPGKFSGWPMTNQEVAPIRGCR